MIRSNLIRSDEKKNEITLSCIFDRLYLPGDEFLSEAEDSAGYFLLPKPTRLEIQNIYKTNSVPRNDIFERGGSELLEGEMDLRKLCEKAVYDAVPAMSGFNIYQILAHKDFDIRSAATNGIYRTLRKTGGKYAGVSETFNLRRIQIKRVICDYIANMTDRSAKEFYEKFIFRD